MFCSAHCARARGAMKAVSHSRAGSRPSATT
jgi:hypothetical protein